MNARCVVGSGAFDQEAYLSLSGNRLSGEFHNSSHNVSGSISITIRGSNSLSVWGSAGGGKIEVALAR